MPQRRVVPPKPTVSILDALSFTSAFWVTLILTNKAIYSSLRSMLIKTHRSTIFREPREGLDASTQGDVVFFDCGVIDTTGIIALLEQRADNIIAFYNNNVPLSQMNSSIAYLFGVDTKTNVVNSLKGSKLTQVFGSDLYPVDRESNKLKDVEVLPNDVGVAPYTLRGLIIVSNGGNDAFRLDDRRILECLSPKWPDDFAHSLPELDSNLLCMYNDFKVRHNRDTLDGMLAELDKFTMRSKDK